MNLKKIDQIIGMVCIILTLAFLYALFMVKPVYTITFDTDGGNELLTQEVKNNNVIKPPENPIKEGYIFVEWQNKNVKFDFTKPIDKNVILKAVWKEDVKETKTTKK